MCGHNEVFLPSPMELQASPMNKCWENIETPCFCERPPSYQLSCIYLSLILYCGLLAKLIYLQILRSFPLVQGRWLWMLISLYVLTEKTKPLNFGEVTRTGFLAVSSSFYISPTLRTGFSALGSFLQLLWQCLLYLFLE